jgi:hypothetical protein
VYPDRKLNMFLINTLPPFTGRRINEEGNISFLIALCSLSNQLLDAFSKL